jgi:sirohydrochlorin cobaltochelatase
VLGDCDEIAGLVAERYREALDGDIRMNCDMCQYRVALPGLEYRVGAPQRPHDHPDDHDHAHGHADAG